MWGVDEIVCVPWWECWLWRRLPDRKLSFSRRANEQSAACTFHQKDTQLRHCGTHQQTNKRTNATNKYKKSKQTTKNVRPVYQNNNGFPWNSVTQTTNNNKNEETKKGTKEKNNKWKRTQTNNVWREHSSSRRDSWDANTAALTRLHGNSDCREKKTSSQILEVLIYVATMTWRWKMTRGVMLGFSGSWVWRWLSVTHLWDGEAKLDLSLSLSVLLPNHSSHARLTTLMVIATTLEIRLSLPHSQTWSQPWKVLSANLRRSSAHVSD